MKKNKLELKNIIWNSIKFAVAAYLVYYLFSLTNISSLLIVLNNITIKYLIVVLLIIVIEIVFISYRFWLLLGKVIPIPKIMNLVIFQKSIAAVIATMAGFAAFVAGMKTDHNIKVSQSVATFLIAKIGDLFAILIFISVSSFFVWDKIEILRISILVIISAISIGFFVLVIGFNNRTKLIGNVEKIYNKFSLNRINALSKLKDYFHYLISIDIAKNIKTILLGLISSLLILCATTSMYYFLNLAFDISIGLWEIIFMMSLQRLMSLIPIYVFGGLGVVDVTSVFLYGLFGFSLVEIAPTIIGFRLINYLILIFVFGLIPLNNMLFGRKTNERNEGLGEKNE